jgi:hypothetical protein
MRSAQLKTNLIFFRTGFAFSIFLSLAHSVMSFAANDILVTKFSGQIGRVSTMGQYEMRPGEGYRLTERRYGRNEMFFSCPDLMSSYDLFGGARVDLFMAEQLKAFDRYLETGYLTRQEVAKYLQNSVQIQDRPISFFHSLTDDLSAGELKGVSPNVTLLMGGDGIRQRAVEASLYLVPGQVLEFTATNGVSAKAVPLPWTLDPEFKEIAQRKFTGNQYGLTWEIGRAAGSGSRDFIHLLAFAGRDIIHQIMHLGMPNPENVKSAFVTFHALNQDNKDKFLKLFPNAELLSSPKDASNVVFIIPLNQFIDRFPPSRSLFEDGAFRKISADLSPAQVRAMISVLLYAKFKLLDFKYQGRFQPAPIYVSMAHSDAWMADTQKIAQAYGLDLTKDPEAWRKVVSTFSKVLFTDSEKAWKNLTFEPSSIHLLHGEARANDAIQVSNFNPKLMQSDPWYLAGVLAAAFDDFVRTQLGNQPGNSENVRLIVEGMIRNKYEFLLTTHHASSASVIQRLNPYARFSLDTSRDVPTQIFWEELQKQGHEFPIPTERRLQGFYFTATQVYQLRAFYDQVLKASNTPAPEGISLGYFWSLLGSSSP